MKAQITDWFESQPVVTDSPIGKNKASGKEGWLAALREDLVLKTYRPQPVRRTMILKPGGGERPLGIPTIRDRVVSSFLLC